MRQMTLRYTAEMARYEPSQRQQITLPHEYTKLAAANRNEHHKAALKTIFHCQHKPYMNIAIVTQTLHAMHKTV